MSETLPCPHCGTHLPAASRFCLSCGHAMGASAPAVAAAVAHEGRLSDSGAIELRRLVTEETRGDYEILEEIGRGGMAVVYRATEVHLARPVAIKVLPPELTFARGATERFRREARTAAALDHPNIIPIYRIAPGGKLFWYAMKFLDGRSLADVLADKGLLTVGETIQILEQVGSALDYAHQRHVVHRDVKPGNVMLDAQGRVIVTDFGIAKELSGSGLTGSGAILGTPYYMSPEQCRGGELTGAADQYSLAVMAYQMISGHLPFEADSAIDVIHKHVTETPPPLDSLLPDLPRHVVNAIARAMAKKPAERFPTVAAFVMALRNAPSDATLIMNRRTMLGAGGTARPAALSTRRLAALAATVLVVLTAAVAGLRQRLGSDAPRGAAGDRAAAAAPDRDTAAAPPAAVLPPVTDAPVRRTTPAPVYAAPDSAAAPRPAGRHGLLRVRIVNGWANIAIADRTIEQQRVWSDSLPAGVYTASFTREGYRTEQRRVTVRAGQAVSVVITMTPATPTP